MAGIKDQADSVYRDFKVDGVPASGENNPDKSEIRGLFSIVDVAVAAAQAGITIVADTAARDTFYATEANRTKLVYVNNNNGSATDPANGVYEYVGGSPRVAQSFYEGLATIVQPLVTQATTAADKAEQFAVGAPGIAAALGTTGPAPLSYGNSAANEGDANGNTFTAFYTNNDAGLPMPGYLESVTIRTSGAATGNILVIDASRKVVASFQIAAIGAGVTTAQAPFGVAMDAGSYIAYQPLTGAVLRLMGNGFTWQVNGDKSIGSTVTFQGIGATVALSFTVRPSAGNLTGRMEVVEAALSGITTDVAAPGLTAEINMVPQFGQSLSRGFLGGLVTINPVPGSLSFNGGVRADDGKDGSTGTGVYASLIPHTEFANQNAENETPCAGVMTNFGTFSADALGAPFYQFGQQMLVCAPGRGATSAADLFNDARLSENITYGGIRAAALGKSFAVPWMGWTHGEQDINIGTTAAAYTTTVVNGRLATEAHAQSVTKTSAPLPMIMSQVATHNIYNKPPTIAMAQSKMCRDYDLMVMTVPRYQFTYVDGQHLTGYDYKMLGAYEGYAASEYVLKGHKLAPVDVKRAYRQGSNVIIEYNVERGPLVFDTAWVSDPGSLGFALVDSSGATITIGTPVVFGGRYVRIPVTGRAPIAGDKIRYAWGSAGSVSGRTAGPRGCLRDSTTYTFDPGDGVRPMHFYALISETTLA